MRFTVHQAKTNLSRLLKKAENGEEVVIARGDQPIAKLVAVGTGKSKRIPGRLVGKIFASADAFSPLSDQELADMGLD